MRHLAGSLVIAALAFLAAPAAPTGGGPARAAVPEQPVLDGGIAFVRFAEGDTDIWLLPVGRRTPVRLTAGPGFDESPAWSPDGRRIAFQRGGAIWLMRADGSRERRITAGLMAGAQFDSEPAWSPDGGRIAFVRDFQLWTMRADGTDQRQLTDFPGSGASGPAWSPGGDLIAFDSDLEAGHAQLWTIQPDGEGLARLTRSRHDDAMPTFSPDGRRIVFAGDGQIYVRNVAPPAERTLLSTQPLSEIGPSWSPAGGRIVFESSRRAGAGLYTMRPDGTDQRLLVPGGNGWVAEPAWQPLPCTVVGSPAGDVLVGTSGADVVCAGAGDDRLGGRGGRDVLAAGAGDDMLRARDGAPGDVLAGGSGDDRCVGDPGDAFRGCEVRARG